MNASPLAVAESVARVAGETLRGGYGRAWAAQKKSALDLVTEMDKAVENLILERIYAAFPSHAVLAEESASKTQQAGLDADHLWIVDPLDGTTNFAHTHPQFCVSIAYAEKGIVKSGVVYDPLRDELFAASLGGGATLNGRPIRVSSTAALDDAMVATGFPYDRRERIDFYLAFVRATVLRTQGDVRRAGAAALDVAWVACGRLDAYFEFGIKPWDVAAGELLVREAGGTVTDMKGAAHLLDGRNTLASNAALHPAMVAMLRDAWPAQE